MDQYTIMKKYFACESNGAMEDQSIKHLVEKQDILGIFPTLVRVSLCYQVAALLVDGLTVVVGGDVAWMERQVTELKQKDVSSVAIHEGLSSGQYFEELMNIRNGMYRIVYVSVERIDVANFMDAIHSVEVSMVIIERAHCISTWSHEFNPMYTQLPVFLQSFANPVTIGAFTSIATNHVREDIIALLGLQEPVVLTTSFRRDDLYYEVKEPKQKLPALCEQIDELQTKRGIVYCGTRKIADIIYEALAARSEDVVCYHLELEEEIAKANKEQFLSGQKNILVTTSDFNLWATPLNLFFMIHYAMPKSMDQYYQETSIVGRVGEVSHCILFYSDRDVQVNKYYIETSEYGLAYEPYKKLLVDEELEKLRMMAYYSRSQDCLREFILTYFGERANNYCGECSSCLSNFELEDVSNEARKIVDCVIAVKEDFSVTMIVNILVGKHSEKIKLLGFDQLDLFGVSEGTSRDRIRDIIHFLIRKEYLQLSRDEYPVLRLGQHAVTIVENEAEIRMELVKPKASTTQRMSLVSWTMKNKLFETLKACRDELARTQGVEEEIIFSDAILHDMASKIPANLSEFSKVAGVGRNKVNKYGQLFIAVIEEEMDRQS